MRWGPTIALWALSGCVLDWSDPEAAATDDGSTSSDTTSTASVQPSDASSAPVTTTTMGTGSATGSTDSGSTTGDPNARNGKWIRTAAYKTSDPDNGTRPPEETARFDVLVTTPNHRNAWSSPEGDSWATLKALNPDLKIYLKWTGPAEYDPFEPVGDEWSWIRDNHGLSVAEAERWTGRGFANPGEYLTNSRDWAMFPGAAGYRDYYVEQVVARMLEEMQGDGASNIAGLHVDGSGYDHPSIGLWRFESMPDTFVDDDPADYYDGRHLHDLYADDLDLVIDQLLAELPSDPPIEVALGFRGLDTVSQWERAENRSAPVDLLVGAGFAKQFGTSTFNFDSFDQRFENLRSRTVGVVALNQGEEDDLPGSGLDRMDSVGTFEGDGTEMTGWEALWLAMCAHMAAIDAANPEVYFHFSVWGLTEYYWLDEFDPELIHLGDPILMAYQSEGVWLREFQDGWVAFNPSTSDRGPIAVPAGQARVIDHDSMLDPLSLPLVTELDVPAHRGVILLKEGHNLDNTPSP